MHGPRASLVFIRAQSRCMHQVRGSHLSMYVLLHKRMGRVTVTTNVLTSLSPSVQVRIFSDYRGHNKQLDGQRPRMTTKQLQLPRINQGGMTCQRACRSPCIELPLDEPDYFSSCFRPGRTHTAVRTRPMTCCGGDSSICSPSAMTVSIS